MQFEQCTKKPPSSEVRVGELKNFISRYHTKNLRQIKGMMIVMVANEITGSNKYCCVHEMNYNL
jgi:hypothetical protein